MLSYLIKRLVALIPTVFFVTIIIFGLQQLLPGDPAIMLAGDIAGKVSVGGGLATA